MNKNKCLDEYTFLKYIGNNKRAKTETMEYFKINNDDDFFEIIYIYHTNNKYIYLYKGSSYVYYSTNDIDSITLNTSGKKRLYELTEERSKEVTNSIVMWTTLIISLIGTIAAIIGIILPLIL